MTTVENVLLQRDGPVAILTLNRPAVKNAVDLATMEDLATHVETLRGDAQVIRRGVTALELFRREAVRACRVHHENAVRVLDFGVTDSAQAYLVMELLDGESLQSRRDKGSMTPQYAAWAVGAAPSHGSAARRAPSSAAPTITCSSRSA